MGPSFSSKSMSFSKFLDAGIQDISTGIKLPIPIPDTGIPVLKQIPNTGISATVFPVFVE